MERLRAVKVSVRNVPSRSAKEIVEMGCEIFVNEGAGSGEEAFDLPRTVTVDDTVLTHPEAMEALKLITQGFGVTRGKGEDGGLHRPPDFRNEGALIVAHLIGNGDFNPQGWTQGRT